MPETVTPPKAPTGVGDIATWVAGGIGVLTAIVGLVGGFTGGIARVARNTTWVLPVVVVLVFVAVLIAFGASQYAKKDTDKSTRRATALIFVSIVIYGAAGGITAWALSDSLATPDRPIISAKWIQANGKTTLSGTVTASGMKANDQLLIVVHRLVQDPPDTDRAPLPSILPPHFVKEAGIVYQQVVGADMDGKSSVTLEVPLPDGGYNALQIVASTKNKLDCPAPGNPERSTAPVEGASPTTSTSEPATFAEDSYACLILDAPDTASSIATTTVTTTTTITTTTGAG